MRATAPRLPASPTLSFPPHEYVGGPGSAWDADPHLGCAHVLDEAEIQFQLTGLPLANGVAFNSQLAPPPNLSRRLDLVDWPDGTYYYRARAVLHGSAGPWSEIRRFTVALASPVPEHCPGLTPGVDLPLNVVHEARAGSAGAFVLRQDPMPAHELRYEVARDDDGSELWAVTLPPTRCYYGLRPPPFVANALIGACAAEARARSVKLAARGRTRFELRCSCPDLLVSTEPQVLAALEPTRPESTLVEEHALGRWLLFEHIEQPAGSGALVVTPGPDEHGQHEEEAALDYTLVAGTSEWSVSVHRGSKPMVDAILERLVRMAEAQGKKLSARDLAATVWLDSPQVKHCVSGRSRAVYEDAPNDLVRFCRIFDSIPPEPVRIGSVEITPEGGLLRCSWVHRAGPPRVERSTLLQWGDVQRIRARQSLDVAIFECAHADASRAHDGT